MKITILVAGFPPAYLGGGPIRTITAMLKTADPRHDVSVITNNFDLGSSTPLVDDTKQWHQWEKAKVKYLPKGIRGTLSALRDVKTIDSEILYLNSFFSFRMSILFQIFFSRSTRSKLVIAPRGELDPGALAHKAYKKRAYILLAKLMGTTRHATWHASSPLELFNIERCLGRDVKVIIRENDTLLPDLALPAQEPSKRLNLVSLSRISPKKNIHILLQALQHVTEEINLDIIGPAEDPRYLSDCLEIVNSLPENVSVTFTGTILSDEVVTQLNKYDLMVCPTSAENFGHVIAESLAAACPVMCADVTPWTEILEAGGGVVVRQHDPYGWSACINDYAKGGPDLWYKNRNKSRESYSNWRNSKKELHFFDLLDQKTI